MLVLAALLLGLAVARPPAVLYPQIGIEVYQERPDSYFFGISNLNADWTVYGSFTERPVNGPDECSTAHSQWSRQDNSLSTTMSRDKLAGCLGQESGAFYVWMTWAGQPVAMRSIPISVLDGELAITEDQPLGLTVEDLSWVPSGVMLLEVGFRSDQHAIANVSLESAESLALIGMTTTVNNSESGVEQRIHFTSDAGAMRENDGVRLTLDNGQTVYFTIQLALQDGELLPDRHRVEMIPFKDSALREPYIASVLGGESVEEGSQICVLIQDTSGAQLDAGSARICSSASSDLSLRLACTASQVVDMVSLEIFNRAANYLNSQLSPEIIDSPSHSQAVFCFSPLKLSTRVHILEVELDTPAGQLTRRSFEWHGNHSDGMWFHCASGYHWNPYFYQCRANGWWNGALLWGALALVVLVLAFGALLYYAGGHWLDSHEWESPHHKLRATGTVSTVNIAAGLTAYIAGEYSRKLQ